MNAQTGRDFLHAILEVGASVKAADAFVTFRGRPPKIDAFLRHNGISTVPAAQIKEEEKQAQCNASSFFKRKRDGDDDLDENPYKRASVSSRDDATTLTA